MSDHARARKLADRIKVVVAETLERRVKDPRLGFITVTDSRVTGDLQHATVFYTVLGDEADRASTAAALESAKGVLRSEVGRRTGIRLTPTLEFVADAIPETAAHIEDLLRRAAEQDARVASMASGAAYAGEPDPYRRDDEDELGTPGDEPDDRSDDELDDEPADRSDDEFDDEPDDRSDDERHGPGDHVETGHGTDDEPVEPGTR